MKKISSILFFFGLIVSSQSSQIDRLETKKSEFLIEINSLKDSVNKIENEIAVFRKVEFEGSVSSGTLVLYSNLGAPLRREPNVISKLISELPANTELIIEGSEGIYYRVNTIYGKGFISRNVVKTAPSGNNSTANTLINTNKTTTKSSSTYTPRKSYSSSRTYYTGPRGGCYYINSNGNKSYVDRNKC